MSPLRCNVPANWNRLVCLFLSFALVLSSLPVHPKRYSANAQSSGPRRTQGPPSPNLPNLDEARVVEPGTPKIMPPVPATKCRGRDEKCKKAKGKISSNLPDNQDRLLSYAGHRSWRDYAGWLKIVIPALSMMDDLIYGSARMISDFPDIPYRSHGDLLTESAVNGANPRGEINGNAASREPRKGDSYRSARSRSLIAAQSGGVVTVTPGANQTPAYPYDSAVISPSNTGHGATTSTAFHYGPTSQAKSCQWSAFQPVSGQITKITLKFDWSTYGFVNTGATSEGASASASFNIIYSTNNGSNWTNAISAGESISGEIGLFIPFSGSGSFSVDLPANTPINQINVLDRLSASAWVNGDGFAESSVDATISNIRLEVETVNCFANVSGDRWRGEYYNNTNLSGSPAMVRDDGPNFLDFNWGVGGPSSACGLGADNFSARWTRTVNIAEAGVYRFSVTGDDGVRLYVDGQLKIDAWVLQAPTTYTADVALTAGPHEVKLEYFENGGGAVARLSWAAWAPGDLSMALINPNNRIGSPGKDLFSRNCNWSLPLLSLPGRAGMDLGLALSLNSLIYTKAGLVVHFDSDQGYPAPGFKLGFPEIRNAFTNTDAGAQSYLLSMPSGRRVEFRQINTNVYEAVDSSYMLLTHDPVNSVFILRTTDGTQFRFIDVTGQGDYKCVQVKDRQGNFITIGYGSLAEIRTITDTLGRVINFNYDGFNHLNSITQNWGGQTHTWATFAYGTQTIQTNFPGLTLNGTTNGAQESVLLRVGLADGSVYSFEYNTYAQVKTIRRYAPNNSNPVNFPGDYFQRAYTTYGLPDNASNPQTDCPRATSRTDWAYDWNPGVTYVYAADPGRTWGQVTFPDGTIYKEFFATTGWQRGLTTQTENWSGGVRKKWTTLQWTQDNTGVSYQLNPRVTETNIYDEVGNRRRTTMSYTSFGLPSDVYEYDANATTVLRRTHSDYNLSAVYTDRRIIGLPSAVYLYDGGANLLSKVDYQYDLGGEFLSHQGPPIQHDTANYGSGFVQGRGNLNRKRRWDVTDPNNQSQASEYETGYNTSGSVIFTRDPLDHQTSASFTDSFSDGQNRNTYAYPTTMTDPDTFPSYIQYNYDFGSVTRTQDPKGAAATRTYDAAGRIDRITNVVNGAYTRYAYWSNQLFVHSYTTVNDFSEFQQITGFDGHDRVRVTVSDHPTSVGQYKAQFNSYDVMGRLVGQTNPTEIDSSWQPAGDDWAAGWVGSSQAYDWQG